MKKFFISAILTLSIAVSAFASGTNAVSAAILRNFNAEYRNVAKVTWTVTPDYARAMFMLNEHKMEVFYNNDGDCIARSSNISLDELPVYAKRDFANTYPDFIVTEAIHFESPQETAYYISAENQKIKVILKVANNSKISTYQKIRK